MAKRPFDTSLKELNRIAHATLTCGMQMHAYPYASCPCQSHQYGRFSLAHPSARKIWTVEWLTSQPRASDKITWSTHKGHKESGKGWNKSPRRQICETVSSLRLRVNSSSKSEVVPPKHYLRIAQILQQPKKNIHHVLRFAWHRWQRCLNTSTFYFWFFVGNKEKLGTYTQNIIWYII